LLPWLVFTI